MWFPLGCGSSLALGCVTGQSWVNIVHVYKYGQGVRVTFGGDDHDGLTTRGRPRSTLRRRSG